MTASSPTAGTASRGPASGAFRRLAAGSFWVLVGRLLFGTAVLLQNAVLARALAPEDLGGFLILQALLLPCAIAAAWGLDLLALREIRLEPGSGARVEPMAFVRAALIVVAVTATLANLAYYLPFRAWCELPAAARSCATVLPWSLFLWPLTALAALQFLMVGVLRALDQVVQSVFVAGLLPTAVLLLTGTVGWLVADRVSVGMLLAMQAAGLVLSLGLCLRLLSRWQRRALEVRAVTRQAAAVRPRDLAAAGRGLMTSQLLAFLVSQSDVWVLALNQPPDVVAQYGVAARLAQLVSLPHLVLCGAIPTLLVAYLQADRRPALERLVRSAVACATVPAVGLTVLFAAAGTTVLAVCFGGFYSSAAPVLTILAIANVVNVFCGPCALFLALSGRQHLLNRLSLANALLCLSLGWLASVHAGPLGVAVVYACGLIVQGIAGVVLVRVTMGVWTTGSVRMLRQEYRGWLRQAPADATAS